MLRKTVISDQINWAIQKSLTNAPSLLVVAFKVLAQTKDQHLAVKHQYVINQLISLLLYPYKLKRKGHISYLLCNGAVGHAVEIFKFPAFNMLFKCKITMKSNRSQVTTIKWVYAHDTLKKMFSWAWQFCTIRRYMYWFVFSSNGISQLD